MIDQAAVDFAFLNSKAARKRLVRVGTLFACLRRVTDVYAISFWAKFLRIERIFFAITQDLWQR